MSLMIGMMLGISYSTLKANGWRVYIKDNDEDVMRMVSGIETLD